MNDISRSSFLRDFLPRVAATGAMLASGALRAAAQATPSYEVDKHVVIVLDMSGSISEMEARAMERAWKDEILAHFSRASVTKRNLRYAFTVVHFNEEAIYESNTYRVSSLKRADAFVHGVLWDKEKDDFRPLKSFGRRGPTRIFGSLRRVAQVFRTQSINALSRDVVFTVDGWQVPYHPDDSKVLGYRPSIPPANRRNDRTIVAARKALEQEFGASVHAIAVGNLEGVVDRYGRVYGWGETYGADQAKSIENLLVTPRGVQRTVTEEINGRAYTSEAAVPPGVYRRREKFGSRLREDIGAILSLDRF